MITPACLRIVPESTMNLARTTLCQVTSMSYFGALYNGRSVRCSNPIISLYSNHSVTSKPVKEWCSASHSLTHDGALPLPVH